MTGNEDSQWVSLHGIVRSQETGGAFTTLALAVGNAVINVALPAQAGSAPDGALVDAVVELNGVCATRFDDNRRLRDVEVRVPSWRQVKVKEKAPHDPSALPVLAIDELFQFRAGNRHRVRVQGTVLLCQTNGLLFIQDSSGGIQVRANGPSLSLPVGSSVEVLGFPAMLDRLPVLDGSVVSPITAAHKITPAPLDLEAALNETLHGRLVTLEGRLIGRSARTAEESLTLQAGRWITDAILQKGIGERAFTKVAPGSTVAVTGVYAARLNENRQVESFQILLRSPADVTVLARPPFWSARHTFWAMGISGGILLLCLGWAGLLRKQVRERTAELREEIEERKRTEARLAGEIVERKRMERQVEQGHKELVTASRQAGMAEVATSVLHNVGNVLNSINVSASLIDDRLSRSRVHNIAKALALFREHRDDLPRFLTQDPKGKMLPGYLETLGDHLVAEQADMLRETRNLARNVEHVKEIVAMQQNYARLCGVSETLQAADLVEDAIRLNLGAFERHHVTIIREFEAVPSVMVEKHKVLQILVNLMRNAKYAMDEQAPPEKQLRVRIESNSKGRVVISLRDNGVGIPAENLTRIFAHGFTTKRDGHGFGLHSGALAAKEMGGELTAHSEGPGKGATFRLELPAAEQSVVNQSYERGNGNPATLLPS
jgi:signal transduction histidine kinase